MSDNGSSNPSPRHLAVDSIRADVSGTVGGERHDQLYKTEERRGGEAVDTADEVDPKGLYRNPDVDDLRWYYTDGPFGKPIVERPVLDAFKYGLSVDTTPNSVEDTETGSSVSQSSDGTPATSTAQFDTVDAALDTLLYDGPEQGYPDAEIKARKDGFALLWPRVKDTSDGLHQPIETAESFKDLHILTIDDLDDYIPPGFDSQLPEGYTQGDEEIDITDSGIVMMRDIEHERFRKPLGYLFRRGDGFGSVFIHHSRVYHLAWRRHVDGPTDQLTWGMWEGDSVLQPVVHVLRAIHKGNWAVMQSLWRHSSPLHVVDVPEGADEDDYEAARAATRNINAKSTFIKPPNWGFEVKGQESDIDVDSPYNVLFDQLCANTEFTKSVLFGTQSGTVSGSETDIKNYYNMIERLRQTRYEPMLLNMLSDFYDWGLLEQDPTDIELSWGPMFKVDRVKRYDAMERSVQLVTQGISNYVLTPDEARDLLNEQWADWSDMSMEELDEEQLDYLDRVNTGRSNATRGSEEAEMENGSGRGTPAVGNGGGGRERGSTNASVNPASADGSAAIADAVDDIVDAIGVDATYTTGDMVATPRGVGVVSGILDERVEDLPGGETVTLDTDAEAYVVGFGGSMGIYLSTAIQTVSDIAMKATTDGSELYYHDGTVNVDTNQLPAGWDTDSLLSYWASVGGEWAEAKQELASEDDISANRARMIATGYKRQVLGTRDQIIR